MLGGRMLRQGWADDETSCARQPAHTSSAKWCAGTARRAPAARGPGSACLSLQEHESVPLPA